MQRLAEYARSQGISKSEVVRDYIKSLPMVKARKKEEPKGLLASGNRFVKRYAGCRQTKATGKAACEYSSNLLAGVRRSSMR
jgi:hypothetical protein